jgi:hypothetical protein
MQITWITAGGIVSDGGTYTATMPSARYRVLMPAQQLTARGHQVSVVTAGGTLDDAGWKLLRTSDIVIVSKIFDDRVLELVKAARTAGAKIVVDLCDDHFDSPALGPVYDQLCGWADGISVGTAALGETVATRFGRHAAVIDDPYEAPAGVAAFLPRAEQLQLTWFGSPANLDTCFAMLPTLGELSRSMPLMLRVVSLALDGAVPEQLEQQTAAFRSSLSACFIPWTAADTWAAVTAADLVLIPSFDDPRKHAKGPNRVVEALRLGRFVVAHPLPAYRPLGSYTWLGRDLTGGIRWALANPAVVLTRIQAGQSYVAARFAPATIASQWEALLQGCREMSPAIPPAHFSPAGMPAPVVS